MAEGKRQVSVEEGLFKLPSDDEEGYLIGSRCRSCGEVFHPKRFYCGGCTSSHMEEVALSKRGKVDSFSIIRMVPPGSTMIAPYGLVVVMLPEGALVTTVVQCDLERLDIGADVELIFEKVKEDEDGNDVMAFKFRLV